MKHIYIINAYKNPSQVKRLINALPGDEVEVYFHLDKKIDDKPFKKELSNCNCKLIWLPRILIEWGTFGIVNVALNTFDILQNNSIKFDYIHFISAQDYPIISNEKFELFFNNNAGKSFLEAYKMPTKIWKHGGMNRLTDYQIYPRRNANKIQKRIQLHFNQFVKKTSLFRRKHPDYIQPYGGDASFSLHYNSYIYLYDYLKKHNDLIKFHKYTLAPDEILFHTVLFNAPDDIRNTLNIDNLRYIDWTKPNVYHPVTFTDEDFDSIKNSRKLFARKFDIAVCESIMDRIDKELLCL